MGLKDVFKKETKKTPLKISQPIARGPGNGSSNFLVDSLPIDEPQNPASGMSESSQHTQAVHSQNGPGGSKEPQYSSMQTHGHPKANQPSVGDGAQGHGHSNTGHEQAVSHDSHVPSSGTSFNHQSTHPTNSDGSQPHASNTRRAHRRDDSWGYFAPGT